MKPWQILLAGILIGLLTAGLVLLIATPIKGTPITLAPPPSPTPTAKPVPTKTPAPIQVQIGGEVNNPGIYNLACDARLDDLINLAGGLTPSADLLRVNYASLCNDGDYFYIPSQNELIPETARNAPQNIHLQANPSFTYPLDLNQATKEELESLPGIGPTKAENILGYREHFGPFTTLEDLLEVEGIGQKTIESLREFLVIEP
jgi:competence protein ComEA